MGRFNLDICDSIFIFYKIYICPILEIAGLLYYVELTSTTFSYFSYKSLTVVLLLSYPTFFIKTTSIYSIIFGIKFVIFIAFLIFIRGGIPRYRYDFLTKLGWIKTLSLILVIFFLTLITMYVN
jgi:NADH:ubiquinone oxidoreductase subunit H